MKNAAAITALLVDVRNVAAHKSVRLEIHVPAEQAALVMEAFGWPTMVNPVPVALARLKVEPAEVASPEEPKPPVEPHNVHRRFAEMPFAKQAALRCKEPLFWEFLDAKHNDLFPVLNFDVGHGTVEEPAAAEAVRFLCGVKSRSEIRDGSDAGEYWKQLDAEYWAWQRGIR